MAELAVALHLLTMRAPYRPAIETAAATHRIDPDLVEAVVMQESGGKADAFRFEPKFWQRYLANSPLYAREEPRRFASSYGLMQVMFTTALAAGYSGDPEGLFAITVNLDIGCRILRGLLDRSDGDLREALAAYNGGWGNRNGSTPQRYAEQVLGRLDVIGGRR